MGPRYVKYKYWLCFNNKKFKNTKFANFSISTQNPPVKPKVRVPNQKVTGQAGNRVQLECMVGSTMVMVMMVMVMMTMMRMARPGR